MNIQITDPSSARHGTSLPKAQKPSPEIDESTPFSQLLRSKEIAGDVAAVVAKKFDPDSVRKVTTCSGKYPDRCCTFLTKIETNH